MKATPEPTPSHTHSRPHSHRRQYSKDSISTLNSPFINRRPLSSKTEQELRAACALILQDFKPSDHGFSDVDPKLDFQGLNRRREHKSGSDHIRVRRPTGAPTESRSTHDARKQSHRVDSSVKYHPDLPMQANTGRRRADHLDSATKDQEARRKAKSPSSDPPRSATMRSDLDSDDNKSVGTPRTTSTDAHLNNGSTAPTSAALTSGRSSKRTSRQLENAAAIADAQAAEWMRQELEKRRQQMASQPQPQPQPEQKGSGRPPSRSKSITSEIREYIFPGSSTLSRTQSSESLRTMNSHSSSQKEPKRSGSSYGWRSWGLQRKLSSRSNSRPGTSKGRLETEEQDKKPELNLNRELPPLPSLDSWNQQEQPKSKENRKSQAQNAHIATVMRSQDQQQQEYAAAVRRHHRRSGSDTLAMRYTSSAYAQQAPQIARSGSQMRAHLTTVPKRSPPKVDTSMDFDEMMSTMDSSKNFDDQLKLKVDGSTHHQVMSSVSRSPSVKVSSDASRLEPPNFSRKISTDVATPRIHEHPYRYQNVVQISPHPEAQKDENKSKLRRVLSGWMLRKDRKDNWMDQFEKNGIKNGVMIQDEAALPPVVRY